MPCPTHTSNLNPIWQQGALQQAIKLQTAVGSTPVDLECHNLYQNIPKSLLIKTAKYTLDTLRGSVFQIFALFWFSHFSSLLPQYSTYLPQIFIICSLWSLSWKIMETVSAYVQLWLNDDPVNFSFFKEVYLNISFSTPLSPRHTNFIYIRAALRTEEIDITWSHIYHHLQAIAVEKA